MSHQNATTGLTEGIHSAAPQTGRESRAVMDVLDDSHSPALISVGKEVRVVAPGEEVTGTSLLTILTWGIRSHSKDNSDLVQDLVTHKSWRNTHNPGTNKPPYSTSVHGAVTLSSAAAEHPAAVGWQKWERKGQQGSSLAQAHTAGTLSRQKEDGCGSKHAALWAGTRCACPLAAGNRPQGSPVVGTRSPRRILEAWRAMCRAG